jgi:hypothetical protein
MYADKTRDTPTASGGVSRGPSARPPRPAQPMVATSITKR